MNSSNQSVIYGHNKYTQIELGNINILISVPHDGFLRPVYLYIYIYIYWDTIKKLNYFSINKGKYNGQKKWWDW